ncbi:MAG: ATP-binding protein, partial [Aeromicrobium sp.]
ANGSIAASSSERAATKSLSSLRPAAGTTVTDRVDKLRFLEKGIPYLITARGVDRSGDHYTVVVATSLAAQSDSLERLNGYLVAFVPLSIILVAAGTWLLLGRALRPVENIRIRAAKIGADHLAERLPVPPTRDEVARLAMTMNEMLARLEGAQQIQRSFVADASHELRGPLATLDASLEIIDSDKTGTAWTDLKGVMQFEVARMERLVDDLLLLAKADDQGLRLRREDVDVDDILVSEVRRLRTNERVTVEAQITPVRTIGDAVRLGQMVRNLVDNAVTAAHSRVRLTLNRIGDEAEILVEDDGDGVDQADRGRIFDRFLRLDASRSRDSGGSGLGLAIVHEIVRGHSGDIEIGDSELGGARFRVRLPAESQPPSGSNR